ncbi:glycosyltransferase [Bacillus sp. NP157]|nr:glycosyltransferase [Bacillus sp. NP157]
MCIANYNGESLLDTCLRSVLDQVIDGGVEIIVHDDASSDRSLEVLATYPSVRVIRSDANVGFCESNNRMVAISTGRFVLLLNNDAALEPGALAALAAAAAQSTHGDILTLPQLDWESSQLVDLGCQLDPFMNPVPVTQGAGSVAMVIGACMWMPRTLWDKIGGFPSWIESIAEDMYVCCAARYLGHDVRCIDGPAYRHMQGKSFGGNRVGNGGLATTYRRRALSERNKTCLLAIFTPTPWMLPVLAVHATTMLIEGLAVSLARRTLRPLREIYLPAIRGAWRRRAVLREERQRMRSLRVITTRDYYSAFTWAPRKLAMLARHGMPTIS